MWPSFASFFPNIFNLLLLLLLSTTHAYRSHTHNTLQAPTLLPAFGLRHVPTHPPHWLPEGPPPGLPAITTRLHGVLEAVCTPLDPCGAVVEAACDHGGHLFTEGLGFVVDEDTGEATLVESVGLWAQSAMLFRDVVLGPHPPFVTCSDPVTIPMPPRTFLEGATAAYGRVFSLSYTDCVVRVFPGGQPASHTPEAQFPLRHRPNSGECWGLAFDPATEVFFVSDGSDTIYVYDRRLDAKPVPVLVSSKFPGRPPQDGLPGLRLNELEWLPDGTLLAVVDGTEFMVRMVLRAVPPEVPTAEIIQWIQVQGGLVAPDEGAAPPGPPPCAVAGDLRKEGAAGDMNGLAVLPRGKGEGPIRVLVTGKRWARMYVVTLPASHGATAGNDDACWGDIQAHLDDSLQAVMTAGIMT